MTGLTSQGHQSFRGIAKQLYQKLGIDKYNLLDAIGDAEDGSENSLVGLIHTPKSKQDIHYLASWLGMMGHQKNILAFLPDTSGGDSLHEVFVGDRDMQHLRKSLTSHGIPFRTLVPGKRGTNIFVYDQGTQLSPNVERFAQTHHGQVHTSRGTGQFVGDPSWTSRSKGRAEYRRVISDYEAAAGGGNSSGKPKPSGQRRAASGGVVQRGLMYEPGQFVAKEY